MKKESSLGFSSFRYLMDQWDAHLKNQKKHKKLSNLLDQQGLSLFFRKDGEIFGCPEDSRVIFARLKTGDTKEPFMPNFKEDIRFVAFNLDKAIHGKEEESIQTLFGFKDLKNIKVISKEKAIKSLIKK